MSADLTLYASIVSATAAVILVVFGLPPFLRWWRERKRPVDESPANVLPPPSAVHVHLWNHPPPPRDTVPTPEQVRPTREAPKARDADSAGAVSTSPTIPAQPRVQISSKPKEVVLFDDTVQIEATGYAEVHRRLRRGTVIDGMVEEASGQSFDFYIMDQRNYARFSEDREGADIYAQEDRAAFSFRKKIPRDGVWYFVFDTYGKQADREVRFELSAIEEG